jgi:hypothetical protein
VQLAAFLISFNRGQMLRQAIAGLRRMDAEIDFIVHDNGSDDDETLEILRDLRSQGISIVQREKITSANDLNNTNETIVEYFMKREAAPYIVSDCDVDMSCADSCAISVYLELLERFPDVGCVGPMLRIRDIPKEYPLYARVMNRHIDQFWRNHPSWIKTCAGRTAYQFSVVDTTLAIHPAGASFRRQKRGIRVYEPFEARHLDWYLTSDARNIYALSSNPTISHWNNVSEFVAHRNAAHEYDRYIVVERTDEGTLIEHEIRYR